jgi:spermidine synthase
MRSRALIGAAALCALVALAAGPRAARRRKVMEKDSHYHLIRVEADTDGFVYLYFDRTRALQSKVKLGEPGYLDLPYARTAFAGLAFLDKDPKRVLFVGLGGGSMPMFMRHHYPTLDIDIAEIDPMVFEVAKEHFGFKEDPKMTVHLKDGRVYLRRAEKRKKKFDVVFLDAYTSKMIPPHLATKEFLEELRDLLQPGGYIVSNIWGADANEFHDAMVTTYQAVFRHFYVLPVPGRTSEIFVATAAKEKVERDDVVARAQIIGRERSFSYDLAALARTQYRYASDMRVEHGFLLTDDRPVVNVLKAR